MSMDNFVCGTVLYETGFLILWVATILREEEDKGLSGQPAIYGTRENQWRSGSASDSNAKGSGFEPRQGKGFSSSYETPEILGAGDFHVLRMRR
jgi:hypothetical protein